MSVFVLAMHTFRLGARQPVDIHRYLFVIQILYAANQLTLDRSLKIITSNKNNLYLTQNLGG